MCLVSKNEESEVTNVLKKHKSMVLKNEDVTLFKVNWKEKYINIKEIANELSLGLSSFVFWDDNPIEREKVRINLKEVDVIEPDEDIPHCPKQLSEYLGFSNFKTSKEDLNKTKQYKMRNLFIEKKNKSSNENDYLKSIKLKPKLLKFKKDNLSRAEQICLKTNQFNFTTKRYSTKDLNLINKKDICYLISLSDLYGDHGQVGLIILKESNKEILIDSFIMSCRILGRYLENWILNQIVKIAKKKKKSLIIAEYKKTNKNNIAKYFLEKNGFKKKHHENKTHYSFNINNKIKNLDVYNEN